MSRRTPRLCERSLCTVAIELMKKCPCQRLSEQQPARTVSSKHGSGRMDNSRPRPPMDPDRQVDINETVQGVLLELFATRETDRMGKEFRSPIPPTHNPRVTPVVAEEKKELQRTQKQLADEQHKNDRQSALLKLYECSPAHPKSLAVFLLEACGRLIRLRFYGAKAASAKEVCRPLQRDPLPANAESNKVGSLAQNLLSTKPGGCMLTLLQALGQQESLVEKITTPEHMMALVVNHMVHVANAADIPPALIDYIGVYMARLDLSYPANNVSVRTRSRRWSQFKLQKPTVDFLRGMTQLRLFFWCTRLPLSFFKGRVGAKGTELYDSMFKLYMDQSAVIRKDPTKGGELREAGVTIIKRVLEPYAEWSKTRKRKHDVMTYLISPEAPDVALSILSVDVLLHLCILLGK